MQRNCNKVLSVKSRREGLKQKLGEEEESNDRGRGCTKAHVESSKVKAKQEAVGRKQLASNEIYPEVGSIHSHSQTVITHRAKPQPASMAFPKKRRYDRTEQDDEYFQCYSDITVHEEMLSDTVRTHAYRVAIARNHNALLGKTVLDVGAGTGILSIFCAQAGARKIYAVEASAVSQLACAVVKENKLEGQVEVLNCAVENAEIPGQVDAIVSEWMGYGLMYESMLSSVLYARDRWLKPGGLLFPSCSSMFIAPINDTTVESRLDFWSEVKDIYGVDMTCVQSFARKCIMGKDMAVCSVYAEHVLSHPVKFSTLDLSSATLEDIRNLTGSFQFCCFGSSLMHGFAIWFSVTFPGEDGITLSTSPYGEETHWKQTILYLDEEVQVEQDTKVKGDIKMFPSESNPRHLCVTINYSIGGGMCRTKIFQMGN